LNEIYEHPNRKYSKKRPQYALAEFLLGDKTGKALDYGCGVGEFSDILKIKGFDVYAVDGFFNFVIQVKERHYCQLVNFENEKLPFPDNFFDIIVSLDVFEHIWNTDFSMGEIKRVLKMDGILIMTTTNYNYYKFRFDHLIGKFHRFTYKSRHKKFYDEYSFHEEIKKHFYINNIYGNMIIFKGLIKKITINRLYISLFCPTIGISAKNSLFEEDRK